MAGFDDLHQVQDFAVFSKQQRMQFGVRVACFEARKHVVCQHQTAHFRQQNDHDGTRRAVLIVRRFDALGDCIHE